LWRCQNPTAKQREQNKRKQEREKLFHDWPPSGKRSIDAFAKNIKWDG
jgi:hypothetical protein